VFIIGRIVTQEWSLINIGLGMIVPDAFSAIIVAKGL